MGRNCEQSCKSAPDYFHNLPDYLLSVFGSRILTKFSEKYRTKILLITCNFWYGLTGSVIFMSKLCSVQTPTNLRWHMGLERQNTEIQCNPHYMSQLCALNLSLAWLMEWADIRSLRPRLLTRPFIHRLSSSDHCNYSHIHVNLGAILLVNMDLIQGKSSKISIPFFSW